MRPTLRTALIATSMLSAACSQAFASFESPDTQVVISPLRYPAPITSVGSSVTVITHQDLEEKQQENVAEALRDVPGLDVTTTGGPGQTTRVLLRGTESRHTLVIIDGLVVNDPTDVGDAYDFSHLTTDNIERIEVLRGPQSTLYGSNAIGGVIAITTRQGSGAPKFNASVEGGSYETYKTSVGGNGQVGRFSYNAQLSQFDTRGFSALDHKFGGHERDPDGNTTFSTSMRAGLTDNLSAGLVFHALDDRAGYDEFNADAPNISSASQWNGRAYAHLVQMNGRLNQEVGVSHMDIDRTNISNSLGTNIYRGDRSTVDWLGNLRVRDKDTLTLGAEDGEDAYRTETDAYRTVTNRAGYGQYQLNMADNFYITAGARLDDNETFGTKTTYRLAPAYVIKSTDTRLKGSVGTGYMAPSLFQLYSSFGNPNLKPETSKGMDAGFEQGLMNGRVKFGSTWFTNHIENLIDYDFITNHYLNIGRSKTRGFENTVSVVPIPYLTLTANYTYLMTENVGTQAELVRRPKNLATFSANYSIPDEWNVMLAAREVGTRQDYDFSFSRTTMPSYNVVDLSGSFYVREHVRLFGRLENLLDKQYEDVYGFATPGFSAFAGIAADY